MPVAGSVESVTVAGLSLDVIGESAGKFPVGDFEKEGIATSGATIIKFKRKVRTIEGLEFSVTPSEAELVQAISNRKIAYNATFALVDGSIYQGPCFIETKERDSMEGKMQIDFIPSLKSAWTQINKT